MKQTGEFVNPQAAASSHLNVPLSSTELSNLWTTCMIYSLLTQVFAYFASHATDSDIRALIDKSQQICNYRYNYVAGILGKEGRALPVGFSEQDINLSAPRLYEDSFYLYYLRNMIKIQLPINSMFFATSVRTDVRQMYHQFNLVTMDVYNEVTDLMLSKGILIRAPHVPTVNQADFVKEQDFMTGFLGDKRPFLAQEISTLHYLAWTNFIGKSLLIGFRQVTKNQAVRDYMDQGIRLAAKIMDTYKEMLARENIPEPMASESMVTGSSESPFSERLMMTHTEFLNAAGLQNIGAAISTSMRRDVSAHYMKTLADIAVYAEDGASLMITNGWLEEAPRHIDREKVSGVKH